ncbi:MAG: trypsin-like peptidase domain-containing protein [Thermogemmatispora sp.]|uniref:S1C family serine protease n=1 Tax=Thermogemmatispora sp. TaxID=1968838 RepID=UPI002619DDE1|nr:trypsin-like peptidase domain-containing protein [Thermogemmatispora sp.]MBX5455519.1 trypsin-like peptidase domain-containing protein [Thermogemmatispora sp.]
MYNPHAEDEAGMTDPYNQQVVAAQYRPSEGAAGTGGPGDPAMSAGSPYYGGGGPLMPPASPPRRGSSFRAVLITLVLAVVLGGLLFAAGWQFGNANGVASATLQTGSSSSTTTTKVVTTDEQAREAAIAKVQPAVVQINVSTASGASGIGSGVIIDKRGYIVTNYHVVESAQQIEVVMADGTHLTAQVAGTDPADDLAVVKINPPSNITVATLGDSSKLQVGQEVLAIGNPLGETQTVTHGIISALGRTVSEEGQGTAVIANAIQTDAPINPGNSGGALVDLSGNVIGIPTVAAIDPEFNTPANGVGFAIPSNRVRFIVQQIIATGQVTHTGRAALGVRVASVTPQLAAQDNLAVDYGSLIVSVTANGPAARAGLRAGDIIVAIDGQKVTDNQSLSDILVNKSPGQTAKVTVYRGNQQLTVTVTLGELQAGS